MKKIVKLHWENYKQSEKGKEAIASFEKLTDSNTSIKDLYKLACKYNPEFFKNTSKKEEGNLLKFLDYLDNTIGKLKEDIDKLNQIRVYHHEKMEYLTKKNAQRHIDGRKWRILKDLMN